MNRLLLLKRVYSTFLLSMLCVLAFAQGKQISGIIKDSAGEPMIGVNVLVKGTTTEPLQILTESLSFRM